MNTQSTATGVNGEQAPPSHGADDAPAEPKGVGRANATTTSPPAPVAPPGDEGTVIADRTATVAPIGDGLEGWTWRCSCGTADKTGKRWTRDSAFTLAGEHLRGAHPRAALTAIVSPSATETSNEETSQ